MVKLHYNIYLVLIHAFFVGLCFFFSCSPSEYSLNWSEWCTDRRALRLVAFFPTTKWPHILPFASGTKHLLFLYLAGSSKYFHTVLSLLRPKNCLTKLAMIVQLVCTVHAVALKSIVNRKQKTSSSSSLSNKSANSVIEQYRTAVYVQVCRESSKNSSGAQQEAEQ